jgi:hypothetical protein
MAWLDAKPNVKRWIKRYGVSIAWLGGNDLPPQIGPARMLEIRGRIEGERGREMGRKRHTPEQIIAKLREAEIELDEGRTRPS